jgi:hypothetical protein
MVSQTQGAENIVNSMSNFNPHFMQGVPIHAMPIPHAFGCSFARAVEWRVAFQFVIFLTVMVVM